MDYYQSFNHYLRQLHHQKVWRLPLSTGYPCPNKIDGKKGCSFCSEESFLPRYLRKKHDCLQNQIKYGIEFFGKQYKADYFYAYFQANTSTYGPVEHLLTLYETALKNPNILGLIISTRPDYISPRLLQEIDHLSQHYAGKKIWFELGLQTVYDQTLKRINRNHSYQDFKNAVIMINRYPRFKITFHTIIGLPGENPDLIKAGYQRLFQENNIQGIKFRLLEIPAGTEIERDFNQHKDEFYQFTLQEYILLLCNILEITPVHVVIMRFINLKSIQKLCPRQNLVKNDVLQWIVEELKQRNTYQGIYYRKKDE